MAMTLKELMEALEIVRNHVDEEVVQVPHVSFAGIHLKPAEGNQMDLFLEDE